MKQPQYVKSNYDRIPDDDYKTIDTRCVDGLLSCVGIFGTVVDCCAPTGSEIINRIAVLRPNQGTKCVGDAFSNFSADWIVTNPPYKKGIVDKILWRQIERVEAGEVIGFATLMRSNFDYAKSRMTMFCRDSYYCQVKLLFRPYWSTERKASPIHNYVWHVWRAHLGNPTVLYYKDKK
jgi:hypothetical protein